MAEETKEEKQESLAVPPAKYTNYMVVGHSGEEFYLSFAEKIPGVEKAAHLVIRLVTSPGHMKRMLKAIEENIAKYEKRFGVIPSPPTPPPKEGDKSDGGK